MRIGLIAPSRGFAGGVERHVYDLACALAARGHELALLHGDGAGRDVAAYQKPFAQALPVARAGELARLDVVYAHKVADARELLPVGDVPLAVAVHDHDLTCARRHRYLPLTHTPCDRAPGVGCVARGCTVVRDTRPCAVLPVTLANPFALPVRLRELAARAPLVACSEYVRATLLDAGVSPSRATVIHPVPPDDDDAASVTAPPRAQKLLVVAQLVRGKGVDLAIDALAELPQGVTLEVVGDGPSRDELEQHAARRAPGRVRFRGYIPPAQTREAYDACDAVLVPSRWPEPFGMVGIEAMRRGRPVVAAAHGGIPEWLDDGVTGVLVAPGDPRALAMGARRVLGDRAMGNAASRVVRERFQHARMVEQVLALLGSVAGRGCLS